jgi:hypothetical protein
MYVLTWTHAWLQLQSVKNEGLCGCCDLLHSTSRTSWCEWTRFPALCVCACCIYRSKSMSPSSHVQQPPAVRSSAVVDDDPNLNSKTEAEVTSSPSSATASYQRSLSVWKRKHQRLSVRLTVVEQNSKKLEAAVDYFRTEVDRLTATIRDISAANKFVSWDFEILNNERLVSICGDRRLLNVSLF